MTAEIAEAEIVAALKANLEAGEAALARNDRVALRALAEQEARYMDELRAIWRLRAAGKQGPGGAG